MGGIVSKKKKPAESGLSQAITRAESRMGKITITGRYHTLPKKLEDDYELQKKVLGEGYNGQVTLATSKSDSRLYAVKPFKLRGIAKERRQDLHNECEIFLGMDHPHVARLVDVYEGEGELHLVMECMTGGELFERIKKKKLFSEADASEATRQMLLAVNYLHSHGIAHRDLKLENFLYESAGSDHLKLIDFGFSSVWKPNTKLAASCGTLAYVAPEVIKGSYTTQCDMWSLGVIVFILLFGHMPFSGSESIQMNNIKAGKFNKKEIYTKKSETARNFVESLLVVDPEKRLTPTQALDHPFVNSPLQLSKKDSQVDSSVVEALADFGKASAFRRACMNVMAWSLTVEERQKVRQAFLELDKDQTGTIKLWEFKQALDQHFKLDDEQAEAAFAALDTSQTDEIHYSEFLAAMCSTRVAMHDDLLKNTFKRFDKDNSGYITADNLRDVLGSQDVQAILEEVDRNTDGKISYEEFLGYLRNHSDSEAATAEAAALLDDAMADSQSERRRMSLIVQE
eukprot:TRINITY_DN1282_c1_g1_i1.p1 TRINITY_DN1282_c1_g1~~TRINITY_DN1282_c1_g1_i1.p1  ORF type:complete len:536 (+),score=126.76 TRINITY_DN1282_c1_g1_i1:72-1610(+)